MTPKFKVGDVLKHKEGGYPDSRATVYEVSVKLKRYYFRWNNKGEFSSETYWAFDSAENDLEREVPAREEIHEVLDYDS
jgi:hypothetical protein